MSEQAENKPLKLAVAYTADAEVPLPVAKQQASSVDSSKAIDLDNIAYYENREVSYFKFNLRVLSQARNTKRPLLERLRGCLLRHLLRPLLDLLLRHHLRLLLGCLLPLLPLHRLLRLVQQSKSQVARETRGIWNGPVRHAYATPGGPE